MKCFFRFLFFSTALFLCLGINAYANIAPLKIKQDGVEPIEQKGVSIVSADISVTPRNNSFIFNCKYVLKGLTNLDSLTLGIPGDPGYALEAGYIENMNILVNGKAIKYKVYNTTKQLSGTLEEYNSPQQFKWHVFSLPVKKDSNIEIIFNYDLSWRIFEQNKTSPYYIVPFLLSIDKLFESNEGKYKITFINDDYISLPDVKIMINSMLEPNIISPSTLTPTWDNTQIKWEFTGIEDFHDFRLIVLSFKKLAMEFSTGTATDSSIKWAMLNNDFAKLASIFESIAKKDISTNLNNNELGTAAYLSSEFYFRTGDYRKALEMLSPPFKTTLWPAGVKYEYVNAINLEKIGDYKLLLDQLKKLSGYKDYVLISNYADKLFAPVNNVVISQALEENPAPQVKPNEESVPEAPYNILLLWLLSIVSTGLFYTIYRLIKQKGYK